MRSPTVLASKCHRGNPGHAVDSCFSSVSGLWLVKLSHIGSFSQRSLGTAHLALALGTPLRHKQLILYPIQKGACINVPLWLVCCPMSLHRPAVYKCPILTNACAVSCTAFITNCDISHVRYLVYTAIQS